MVVETLWPDNAPWWLNLFIWMAFSWQWILIGFVPAFYIAVVKLFGMPLLQRWSSEVVIMLDPTKAKFGKITQQMEPYFRSGKGIYWHDQPLLPMPYETSIEELPEKIKQRLDKLREKYDVLSKKEIKTKKDEKVMKSLVKKADRLIGRGYKVNPINQIHIYSRPINQPIYNMERRESKVDEILNNNPTPKRIPNHGIWILQNPRLHFHRHWQVIKEPLGTYKLIPVKQRQQFSIGFWHSLGVVLQKEVETEKQIDIEGSSSSQGKQLIQTLVTTNVVIQQMKQVQDYQNFSASRAYMLLKRRAKIEGKFMQWIKGDMDPMFFLVLGGAIAVIAVIYLFLGHTPTPSTGPPAPGRIL